MNNIKDLMESKGFSQRGLARISGVNNSLISRLISGKRNSISLLTAQKLAKALKVSINRLGF